MRKILPSLIAGIAIGVALANTNPETKVMEKTKAEHVNNFPAPAPKTKEAKQEPDTIGPETVELTEADMEAYGHELYWEVYNGECMDMEKFMAAREQLKEIYRRYGFERARDMYKSFSKEKKETWKIRACGFPGLSLYGLNQALLGVFTLEDYWKIEGDDYEGGEFPDYEYNGISITEYLENQPRDIREKYIADICEGKERYFLDPTIASREYALSQGNSTPVRHICRNIARDMTEDTLNSTSIGSYLPEIELAKGYDDNMDLDRDARYDQCDYLNDEKSWGDWWECIYGTPLETTGQTLRRLAEIACKRRREYPGMLEQHVDLALSNFEILERKYEHHNFRNYNHNGENVKEIAEELCGGE